MELRRIFLLALLWASPAVLNGEKILVFIGVSSYSHRVAIQPLITKLSEVGHDVTVFSPIKAEVKNPKIQEFVTQSLVDYTDKVIGDSTGQTAAMRIKDRSFNPFFEGTAYWDFMVEGAEVVLKAKEFQDWIKGSHFDLIIFDQHGKEYLLPIAHHMKAKIIEFVPQMTPQAHSFDLLGHPLEPWFHNVEEPRYLSFLPARWFNAYSFLSWYLTHKNYYLPKVEALVREVFPFFDFPPLEELQKKTDLMFVNNHPSMGYTAAYPPYIIPVAGLHVQDSNGTLPKDIEDFLADTEQFVFISFGSIIRISALPRYMQQIFFDSVAAVPNTKFLWKWEGDLPKNLPKNALARKWFPQQDVLAHKKCKGFITQGGLMSLQQSVYHNVPVLVIPGFGDQPFNAQMVSKAGYGIHLELADITKESFSNALEQLLNNPVYSKRMSEASREFKDRPMPPVDTAVWWVEYVLRHDTSHLKSEGVQLTWWQRRMLDFWFLIFLGLALIFSLTIYLAVSIFTKVCSRQSDKLKKL